MEDTVSQRKLFVGGLSSYTTRENLSAHFEKYGKVQDSILMVDRLTGRSRCFGFIIMQDPSTLDTILAENQIIDEKKVDCKRAVPRNQSSIHNTSASQDFKTKKMFVGGLPPDITNEMFREFFQRFGEIEDSVVILDKETGRPRGFGFVTFTHDDATDKVLENYEKNMINGKWVECKKATPKQSFHQSSDSHPYYSFPTLTRPVIYNNFSYPSFMNTSDYQYAGPQVNPYE